MSGLEFIEPPATRLHIYAETLRELAQHPGKWARVAVAAAPAERRRWEDAKRKVGANGEFTIRQAISGGPGSALIDVYARYDEDEQ